MSHDDDVTADDSNVRVAVRCRPLNGRERGQGDTSCFAIVDDHVEIVDQTTREKHQFKFDFMYDDQATQEQVYKDNGSPLLDKALAGFNATIFAYGQTGSGKTHCMSGSGDDHGIIPRMTIELFERIETETAEHPSKKFLVLCSYFEVYNEIIYDLLDPSGATGKNRTGLDIREDKVRGIYVKDLQEIVVDSAAKMSDLMNQGNQQRTQSATKMNERSSRSHSIFCIKIQQKDEENPANDVFAKLNLVDLAGSERASKTGATGSTLKEGANINKSLTQLGMVINKLAEAGANPKKNVFIPYRNSKLTRVLQESLGGNSLCCMVATLSPAQSNIDETLTTLRYADRAKSIPVKATKNEAGAEIARLNREIAALRKQLEEGVDHKSSAEIEELELAARRTWDDQQRLSEQYENERKRLQEQQAAEKAALMQQYEEERRRRWELLKQRADLAFSIRDLFAVGSPAGKRAVELQIDTTAWLTMLEDGQLARQTLKEQATVAVVYRDGLDKDVAKLDRIVSSGDEHATNEADLVDYAAVLLQAHTQITSLQRDGLELLGAQDSTVSVFQNILQRVTSAIATVAAAASRPVTPAAAQVPAVAGGAEGASGDPATGAAAGAAAEPQHSAASDADAEAAEDSRNQLLQALELVKSQAESLVALVVAEIEESRTRVFHLQATIASLLKAVQLELQRSNAAPEEDGKNQEAAAELQGIRSKYKPRLEEVVALQAAALAGTMPMDQGSRRELSLVAWCSKVVGALREQVNELLAAVRQIAARQRAGEGARLKALVVQLRQTTEELAGVKEQLETTNTALSTERRRLQSALEAKSQASEALATTTARVESLEAEMRTHISTRDERIGQLEATVQEWTARATAAETSNNHLQSRLTASQKAEAEAAQAAKQLTDRLQAATTEAGHGAAAAALLAEERENALRRAQQVSAELEANLRKLEAASIHEAQLEASLSSAEAAQRRMKDEQTELASKLLQTEKLLEAARASATSVEAILASVRDENKGLQSRLEGQSAKISELEHTVHRMEVECAEADQRAEELQVTITQLKSDLGNRDTELANARADAMKADVVESRAESRLAAIQAKLDAAMNELQELNNRHQQATVASQELENRCRELEANLNVALEERDAAREKEEEYYVSLQATSAELSRIQEGYIEVSDRLNDKLDELVEMEEALESARASALHWQHIALSGNGAQQSASAAGSGGDAVAKRKKEHLLRSTIAKLYQILSSSGSQAQPRRGSMSGQQLSPVTARAAAEDDEYEEDFEPESPVRTRPKAPTHAISVDDIENMSFEDLCDKLQLCATEVWNPNQAEAEAEQE